MLQSSPTTFIFLAKLPAINLDDPENQWRLCKLDSSNMWGKYSLLKKGTFIFVTYLLLPVLEKVPTVK